MLIRSGQNCQMSNQKEKDICLVKKEKNFSSPDFEYQKMVQEGNGAVKRPTTSVINDCFFFQCYIDHHKCDSCINVVTHMPLSSQQICTLSMDVHDRWNRKDKLNQRVISKFKKFHRKGINVIREWLGLVLLSAQKHVLFLWEIVPEETILD